MLVNDLIKTFFNKYDQIKISQTQTLFGLIVIIVFLPLNNNNIHSDNATYL